MRILVYGAGAIGGYLGALLAQAGADVTLLARGAQLDALRQQGVSLEWADGRTRRVPVSTCGPGTASGRFDLILVTLKSMQLAAAAADIAALLAPGGSQLMIQNGLPWWYFESVDSPWRGTRLNSLDPDGRLAHGVDLAQVIGAVIYKPVMVVAPGRLFIPDVDVDRLIIGEIDNRITERVQGLAALLSRCGMPTTVGTDIRAAKWTKLMSNLVWSPLCALTQSTSGRIAALPGGAAMVRKMMSEGSAVAAAVGVRVDADPERELLRVRGNFSQLPSMLQDVRAGRPLEIDAILGAVIEIAGITGVAVPTLANVAACVTLLDQRIRDDGVAFSPAPVRAAIQDAGSR